MPGLNSIEEIRKRLSPISTPTSKWGFVLKQDPAHEIRTPKMVSKTTKQHIKRNICDTHSIWKGGKYNGKENMQDDQCC